MDTRPRRRAVRGRRRRWCVVVLDSALRTFVLPRGAVVRLTRVVSVVGAQGVRPAGCASPRPTRPATGSMALYGPIAMFALVILWIVLVLAGFTMIFVAVEGVGWKEAFYPERLVDVHARLRAADRLLGRDARLRRGGDRARAARAPDRVPPDDLRRVLAARGARRAHVGARGHAAERGGPASAARTSSASSTTSTTSGSSGSSGSPSCRRPTRRCRS